MAELRRRGESYSEAIIRLVKAQTRSLTLSA